MLTVTVPDEDLLDRLRDLSDRVEFVLWDMFTPLPDEVAARVQVVQIPHYCVQTQRWRHLRQLSALRYVLLPSAGYEHAEPWIPPDVTFCNGRGVHASGTAELAVALVLASQRGLVAALDAQREGRWHTPELPSLADRRVLIVGAGALGSAIAARLQPFEVDITQVARTARGPVLDTTALPEILPRTDILILAVPGSPSTRHLIDAEALAALPNGALLVNVGRGQVVDTSALVSELVTGRLRAALDVTDPEPLPADHPLWRAPNTIITAHQGGNSTATYPRVASLLRSQLESLLSGQEPANIVGTGRA